MVTWDGNGLLLCLRVALAPSSCVLLLRVALACIRESAKTNATTKCKPKNETQEQHARATRKSGRKNYAKMLQLVLTDAGGLGTAAVRKMLSAGRFKVIDDGRRITI